MKRTQKDINQEIKTLEAQIDDIENIRKHCPKLVELENEIRKIKDAYWEEVKTQREVWKSDIDALHGELIKRKQENELQISDRVKQWFRNYTSGVSFGYKEPKIVWISEDERFVIITSPGGTAGTGTPMGTGGYYYASSIHWLADTTNNRKYVDWSNTTPNKWKEFEGRLTKEKKQEIIDFTEELRKS